MMDAWRKRASEQDRSVHGKFFELVIGESLAQGGVSCLYYQAEVLHVPLSTFDWFLYHETHPVSISCKTKARDRWKQAAHEAAELKRVYIQATNYLVTLERISATVEKKTLAPLSIDHFIVASEPEYSEAVAEIAQRHYSEAIEVAPVPRGHFVGGAY